MKSKNLKKCTISDLKPDMENIELEGVVISIQESRTIASSKNPLKPLNVFRIVLRDSPIDFVCCSVWGTKEYVDRLTNELEVNTCVRIRNPLVRAKVNDQVYDPWTPSQVYLSLNESEDAIEILDEVNEFNGLINEPIRQHNDFYTLENVEIANPDEICQKSVNLLFIIREIREVEHIKDKNGNLIPKLELHIFDKTKVFFKLTIWDQKLMEYALSWKAYMNVIFAVDIKIKKNDFTKSMEASTTSRTIFIANPNTKDAYQLYRYGRSCEGKLPPVVSYIDQIKKNAVRCSVQDLKSKLCEEGMLKDNHVIINAYISGFNIDSESSNIFSFTCKRCGIHVNETTMKCPNQNCKDILIGYDKRVNTTLSISDHTATLDFVHVNSRVFEEIVGYTVEAFRKLSLDQKTNLKWRILMERKKLLIKINCKTNENDSETTLKYYFTLLQFENIDKNDENIFHTQTK